MTDTTPIHSPKKSSSYASPRRLSGSSRYNQHYQASQHHQVQEPQALQVARAILQQQHNLLFVQKREDLEDDDFLVTPLSNTLNVNQPHFFKQRITNNQSEGILNGANGSLPNGHSTSAHVTNNSVNISHSNHATTSNNNNNNASHNAKTHIQWFELELCGLGIRSLSTDIGIYSHLTALYLNHNKLAFLPEEIFKDLKALNTLDLAFNQLIQVPKSLCLLSTLDKLFLNDNQIRELPVEMGRLFRLQELRVYNNPITSPPAHIMEALLSAGANNSTPSNSNGNASSNNSSNAAISAHTQDLIGYLRDRIPIGESPPERRFISYIDPHTTVVHEKDRLRVFSYNILAEQYATVDKYFYCPSWALDWSYRKQRVLQEMLMYDCDILCLQEVEALQYSSFFEPEMSKAGYGGFFAPKSRARTMEDWSSVDGCVIFYKKSKFVAIEEHVIEYQSIGMSKHREFQDDPEAFSRLITKDNIGIVLVLQLIGDSSPQSVPNGGKSPMKGKSWNSKARHILISNTHIHWNPEHADVKLMQVQLLLEQIQQITGPTTKWYKIPMILCGDFNSAVDSGPYELLSSGRLGPHHNDLSTFNYGTYTKHGMSHSYHLSSAYSPLGEPSFTNYTSDFVGVLDYLWFSTDSLAVSKVLQPVDEEVVKVTRLPNAFVPSDHISILSEFYFIK